MSRNSDLPSSLFWNGHANGPCDSACSSAFNSTSGIAVDNNRLFGLNAGDWTVLVSGFGLSALAVLLL